MIVTLWAEKILYI